MAKFVNTHSGAACCAGGRYRFLVHCMVVDMKEVTPESVREHIQSLMHIQVNTGIGISLREEFYLDGLRKLSAAWVEIERLQSIIQNQCDIIENQEQRLANLEAGSA